MASIRSKNSKWQARIKRGAILVEKSFLNKRDAERWARLTETEIDRGEYQPPGAKSANRMQETLNDILTRYDLEVAPLHRSGTSRFNIRVLKRALGETPLADFNAQVIAKWRDERLKSVKPPTVARNLNTLSAILNHARKEWCYPIVNPIPDIKRPAQSQSRARRLEDGEEGRVLAGLESHYGRVVRFALATGMRRGEVLSLTWRNVDMIARVALLTHTKNGDACRVPLSSAALNVLNEERQESVKSIRGAVFDIHKVALDTRIVGCCCLHPAKVGAPATVVSRAG